MRIVKVLFTALLFSGIFFNYLIASEELILKGKSTMKKGDFTSAINIFWKAARAGNLEATNYLSALYILPGQDFDRETFDSNIQIVTEKFSYYQTPSEYFGRFVIISSEKAIKNKIYNNIKTDIKLRKARSETFKWGIKIISVIGRDPLTLFILEKNMSYLANNDNYINRNISSFRKSLVLKTHKGKICARAKMIKKLGVVAVVDRDTACQYFKFSTLPDQEWSVYVRCPDDEDFLIPFGDFHKYVYERKMQAFSDLCRYLGAYQAKISYGERNNRESSHEITISGEHKADLKAQAQVNIDTSKTQTSLAKMNFKWQGSSTVYPVEGYWLTMEPSWKAMHDSRLDLSNSLEKYIVEFNYTNDYLVNVKTKTSFENADMNINLNTNHRFREMQETSWFFEVSFPPVKEISKEVKRLK